MAKQPPFQTLLLEDEKPARKHFASVIQSHPDLTLINTVENCAEAIAALKVSQPDILVADLGLPDGNGVKVIRHAKALYPDIEILVVTMFGDEENVVAALEAGASGYLLKKQAFEELGDAMLSLMRGEAAISPEVARYLLRRFKKEDYNSENNVPQQTNPLTSRENEVLGFIAKGLSYDEIADAFSLSTNTVRAHIRNIYKKLSVNSKSEAIFEASQLGFIKLK
ncbi:MAG: response regulator transcription factor [Ghiorsea sp.]